MAAQQMHGRGGAGNLSEKPTQKAGAGAVEDLQTPTIKQQVYTTGRGGSGNMASNDSAESARKAQDLDPPVHHQKEMKGTYHWGRGGEGNQVTLGEDKTKRTKSKERTSSKGEGERRGSAAILEKGKEMLGWKEKGQNGNGSAIADD